MRGFKWGFEFNKYRVFLGLRVMTMHALIVVLALNTVLCISGCSNGKDAKNADEFDNTFDVEGNLDEDAEAVEEEEEEVIDLEALAKGDFDFSEEKAFDYISSEKCLFDMESQQLIYSCDFENGVPSSDDENVYVFALAPYESDIADKEPVAMGLKFAEANVNIEYTREYLFATFYPALKVNDEYVLLSDGSSVNNPEILAPNQDPYPEIKTKKGLLIDPATIGDEKLTNLGIGQAIYNIPLSQIIGESTNPDVETIEFEYADNIYHFNGATIQAYDYLFTYLENEGVYTTAIILNDWNENHPELMHPLSRNKTSRSLYYAFNDEEKEGVQLMEAAALFLAERYSDGWHGRVYNWVIANEINQQTVWNYMDTTDLDYYAKSFEKSFRIFYNAIKSRYANAGVYFSIDHDWNDNNGDNSKWFNGYELLEAINNNALEHGNYDWGIAIHPYPNPLSRANYWSQEYDMTRNAPILTLMNLSSLTEVLEEEQYRDTKGEVRSVTITELGFTSYAGEKLQAAAFAYCYYIIDSNPYVDSFMMNRQTDAWEELRNGLAFGVYNADLTDKYIMEVFKYIDTDKAEDYHEFMLNILGAESLDEALAWARP